MNGYRCISDRIIFFIYISLVLFYSHKTKTGKGIKDKEQELENDSAVNNSVECLYLRRGLEFGSQYLCNSTPGNLTPSSGVCRHTAQDHIHTNTHKSLKSAKE